MRIAWPGLVARLTVAPANAHKFSVLSEIVEDTRGFVVWDRNYHAPRTREGLLSEMGPVAGLTRERIEELFAVRV